MEPRKKIEVTSKQAIELAEALEVIVMKLRDELALHEANVQQLRLSGVNVFHNWDMAKGGGIV